MSKVEMSKVGATGMTDPSMLRAINRSRHRPSTVSQQHGFWNVPDATQMETELDALLAGINPMRATWTWKDELYEDDADVMVVFDIDHKRMKWGIIVGYFPQLVIGILLLTVWLIINLMTEIDSVVGQVLVQTALSTLGFKFVAEATCRARAEVAMVERYHVAIARHGVYLDETDIPGSLVMGNRKVIDFESILDCWISDHGTISIKVHDRDGTTSSEPAVSAKPDLKDNSYTLPDITEQAMFVALVRAMKARASRLRTTEVYA
jgi:hypothetical protein